MLDQGDGDAFDSVAFIALLGDVSNTSVLTLTVKSNPTSSDVGGTSEGATAAYTATATDADNKLLIVDVHRPTQRFVFASLTRTVADAVVDGIIAVQYNARDLPVSQPASVLASAFSQRG